MQTPTELVQEWLERDFPNDTEAIVFLYNEKAVLWEHWMLKYAKVEMR